MYSNKIYKSILLILFQISALWGLIFGSFSLSIAQSTSDGNGNKQLALQWLDTLKGSWRFEIIRTGNPETRLHKGRRTFSETHNEHALEWNEQIDGADIEITGMLGYDQERDEFYEFGLASIGPGEYLIGRWDDESRAVIFTDSRSANETNKIQNIFRLHDANRFEFIRLSIEGEQQTENWRAVFVRD